MRILAAITLLTAISPWAGAQRTSGFSPHPGVPAAPGFTGIARNGFSGNAASMNGFARGNHGFAVPFLTDALYSDLLATGYPAASQPPMIFMQAPSAPPAATPVVPSAPAQALMIELQGDHYVRVSGNEGAGVQMIDRDTATAATSAKQSAPPVNRPKETIPATLVFRDGHREEIADYTITDGIVYAHADYYKTGSWNRKIEVSSLDLPQTLQLNQSHGLHFQIPSSPNEVIVGP